MGVNLNLAASLARARAIARRGGRPCELLALAPAKNGVIDHANPASSAIRIITLFEFSVKSSIFITTS